MNIPSSKEPLVPVGCSGSLSATAEPPAYRHFRIRLPIPKYVCSRGMYGSQNLSSAKQLVLASPTQSCLGKSTTKSTLHLHKHADAAFYNLDIRDLESECIVLRQCLHVSTHRTAPPPMLYNGQPTNSLLLQDDELRNEPIYTDRPVTYQVSFKTIPLTPSPSPHRELLKS